MYIHTKIKHIDFQLGEAKLTPLNIVYRTKKNNYLKFRPWRG